MLLIWEDNLWLRLMFYDRPLYQCSIDYLWRLGISILQNSRQKRYTHIVNEFWTYERMELWMHYFILRYRIKWMLAFNGLWWISKLWISLVVIFGDYLCLGILLKLIIDGKSVVRVNLNEWALERLLILKGT